MSIRVLAVDDDADARALCHRILRQEGYEVTEASDGLDALAKISCSLPDVIIMDAVMPNLDGLECTRRLKADPATREIPVIMVSARTEAEDIEASLEAGVDEYVTKPLRPREFVLRVRSMARLYRSKSELIRSNEVRGEQARALGILLNLSRTLATASSFESILDNVISATAELTCSRRISIMLPDQQSNDLAIAKAIGIDEKIAAAVRIPVGAAIAGRVFASGNPIVVNTVKDAGHHTNRYDSEFFVSVPLVSKALSTSEHIVGVLNIAERQGKRPFDRCELEYVDIICNMAASAIDEFVSRRARDEARDSVVVALATLAEYRDADTGKHLDRVTKYALILAQELRKTEPFCTQIDDQFLQDLQRAMPLHDVGKIVIPDHILLKPGKLTPAEMAVMKKHAELGAEALRSVVDRAPGARFLKMAEHIAQSHHEWYDGSGYPRAIQGQDIPLAARIAALADVYDALTTKRPYKDPVTHEQAGKIIREASGSQFDPAVVEAFLRRKAEFADLASRLADDPVTAEMRPGDLPHKIAVTENALAVLQIDTLALPA